MIFPLDPMNIPLNPSNFAYNPTIIPVYPAKSHQVPG